MLNKDPVENTLSKDMDEPILPNDRKDRMASALKKDT